MSILDKAFAEQGNGVFDRGMAVAAASHNLALSMRLRYAIPKIAAIQKWRAEHSDVPFARVPVCEFLEKVMSRSITRKRVDQPADKDTQWELGQLVQRLIHNGEIDSTIWDANASMRTMLIFKPNSTAPAPNPGIVKNPVNYKAHHITLYQPTLLLMDSYMGWADSCRPEQHIDDCLVVVRYSGFTEVMRNFPKRPEDMPSYIMRKGDDGYFHWFCPINKIYVREDEQEWVKSLPYVQVLIGQT